MTMHTILCPLHSILSPILYFFFVIILSLPLHAQPAITWQQNIGTPRTDIAHTVFFDLHQHLIVIGEETHADFTGQMRPYMFIARYDQEGTEQWKQYHDVPFETFNPPGDYHFGKHFYTVEFGDTLLNLVLSIQNQTLLYKLSYHTGEYYTHESILSPVIDVAMNNDKVYANVLCTIQQACYGPDSLVIQKFDPTPDSIFFDPVKWTFEMAQNIRTTPVIGHYDFQLHDLKTDSEGNTYILAGIEKWDFQFCTDCNDAFVDAWCEIFKIDAEGFWVDHKRLKIAEAIVNRMQFVSFSDEEMVIQIDDINAAGTAVVSSVYYVKPDLQIQNQITLGQLFHHLRIDANQNLIGVTNASILFDSQVYGLTDILLVSYTNEGDLLWKKYLGGSDYDFNRGLLLGEGGGIFVLGHTASTDFDVQSPLGEQDVWLVRLGEQASAVDPNEQVGFMAYPNPANDVLHVEANGARGKWVITDLPGHTLLEMDAQLAAHGLDIEGLLPGMYWLHLIENNKAVRSVSFLKM